MKAFLLKRNSVVFSWLLSYLSVLLIPILLSIAIYYNTAGIIKDEINNANSSMLQQIQQVIDGHMQDVKQLKSQIELDNNLQNVINITGDFDASDKLNLLKMISDFHTFKNANSYIDDFFIYFDNQGSVITPSAYYEKAIIDNSVLNSDINYKDLTEKISAYNGSGPLIFLENREGSNTKNLVYCASIISSSDYKPEAKVVFLIDLDKFIKAVDNITWSNKGTVLILDSKNQMIFSTQQINIASGLKYSSLTQQYGIKEYSVKGENYTASFIASNVMQWKYISVIPTKMFASAAYAVRNFTYISLIISLLIGALISFIATRKNYNPINRLVNRLSKSSGLPAGITHNEYNYIEDAINNTVKSKEKMEDLLRSQNQTMRSNLIVNIMKGKMDADAPVYDILASYDMDFLSEEFIVMIFYIEDIGEDKNGLIENRSLLWFAIRNVVEELSGQNHKGYVVEIDEIMACLLNLNRTDDEGGDALRIAEEAKTFFSEKMDVCLSVAISQKHEGLQGIAEAYDEAVEIMGYRMFMENGKIIQYQDIQKNRMGGVYYNYPISTEQMLINYIKAGDLEKSQNLLNEIFENNFKNNHLTIALAKCMAFDLVGTIVKTLDEIDMLNEKWFQGELNPVDRMIKCNTITDMKKEMGNILVKVCTYLRQNQKEHNTHIMNNVMEYVQEHFVDDELSVSQIADQFKMSLSYISKQFKKQCGLGLYDYINKIRVEKAKELLVKSRCNISVIAKQVGFYNDNSLIRVFKKYEGITPGKYKEMNSKTDFDHPGKN
jgi:AraC-like DNA-binding protein